MPLFYAAHTLHCKRNHIKYGCFGNIDITLFVGHDHQVAGLNQHYIATQLPLMDTVADFWQMVKHHRCVAVVYVQEHLKRVGVGSLHI